MTEQILFVDEDTHARLVILASEMGVNPKRALELCVRHSLAVAMGGTQLGRNERSPIPWAAKNSRGGQRSPANARGFAQSGNCHGCGATAERLYCPTCRQRAGVFGWCGCGAALYGGRRGMPICKPKGREKRSAHAEHKRGVRTAQEVTT